MPGLPFIQKKSRKFIRCDIASIMLGESPIIVAEPCRFELTAMPIRKGTGFAFNFFATSNAMGATISTVATFSVKLDIKPDRKQIDISAMPTFFDLAARLDAKNAGTFE
jgi:hypothetical protein